MPRFVVQRRAVNPMLLRRWCAPAIPWEPDRGTESRWGRAAPTERRSNRSEKRREQPRFGRGAPEVPESHPPGFSWRRFSSSKGQIGEPPAGSTRAFGVSVQANHSPRATSQGSLGSNTGSRMTRAASGTPKSQNPVPGSTFRLSYRQKPSASGRGRRRLSIARRRAPKHHDQLNTVNTPWGM